MIYQDEEKSFKIFTKVIDMMLLEILQNNLLAVKKNFFIMDCLINDLYPDLSQHFCNEHIESSLFISPWILTLLTSSFQYSPNSHYIYIIWDFIIFEGWKGFYKVVLYFLGKFKRDLLCHRFDQILFFMNEMIKNDYFILQEKIDVPLEIYYKREKEKMKSIPVKKRKIFEFERKFEILQNILNKL